jgi:hypothetical protein
VHELTRSHVQTEGARLRPFAHPHGFTNDPNHPTRRDPLEFTLWELFHATKKAELIAFRPRNWFFWSTVGSLLEHIDLFAPVQELRLNPGFSRLYGDFTTTGLAGRLGQGLTILFMQRQGYAYGIRLESLLARAQGTAPFQLPGIPNGVALTNTPPNRAPDFIFELDNPPHNTALAESKGAFVYPRSQNPNVIGRLREGLLQLQGWDRCLVPPPAKGFVIGALIREDRDPSREPSMICFVDPENPPAAAPAWQYPDDAIRRGNYAAWLAGMGFQDTAADLIAYRRRETVQPYPFALVEFAGRKIALPWAGSRSWRFLPYLPEPIFPVTYPLLGIDLTVIRAIENAVLDPHFTLRELRTQRAIALTDGPVVGSLFSDGTFFGKTNEDVLFHALMEEIKL